MINIRARATHWKVAFNQVKKVAKVSDPVSKNLAFLVRQPGVGKEMRGHERF